MLFLLLLALPWSLPLCLFSIAIYVLHCFVRVHIFNLTLFGLVTCAIALLLSRSLYLFMLACPSSVLLIFRSFNCNLYSAMINIYKVNRFFLVPFYLKHENEVCRASHLFTRSLFTSRSIDLILLLFLNKLDAVILALLSTTSLGS